MNLFDLGAIIRLDTSKYEKGLNDAHKMTVDFGEKLKTTLTNAAKVGAAAIGAVSGAIVALGKIGMDYNSQMETYTTNFTTMLGSTEAAVAKVEELKKFAASTPLSMDDLARGTQTLLAFGVASEDSTATLRALGDIALGDAQKLQTLTNAFGKANAQGKLTGEVVQSMIGAGFNPLLTISERTGESMEDLQKRMSKGEVTLFELQQAIADVTTGTGKFAGGMEAASHTTKGLMSTLQDNARALVGEVFTPISESMLNDVLPMAIDSIQLLSIAFKNKGIDGMIDAAEIIIRKLIAKITDRLPMLINTATKIVTSIVKGITQNLPQIVVAAVGIAKEFTTAFIDMLPIILDVGIEALLTLIDGIIEALPELIPAVVDVVIKFVDTLTNPDNIARIVDGAIKLMVALANGLIEALPRLIEKAPEIIKNLVTAITENFPLIVRAGIDTVTAIGNAILDSMPTIIEAGGKIVDALKQGIFDAWGGLLDFFGDIWEEFWHDIKVDLGFFDNIRTSNGKFAGGLDYVPRENFPATLHRGEMVLTKNEADEYRSGETNRNNANEKSARPIKIIVQSVLDGRVIGETAYNYMEDKEMAVT